MKHTVKILGPMALLLCLGLMLAPAAMAIDPQAIKEADEYYAQRADLAKAKQAAQAYEKILAADPKKEEAAWKLARTLYYIGMHTEGDDAKAAIFEKGIAAAKKAIALNPKSVGGHFWLGVNYGVFGSAKGVTKSLSLVDPIKQEMATVIELDPEYEAGGPYRVLGRLYFKLPGLFGGDNDLAVENLNTAVKKGPKRYLNHIYLAEVLIDEGEDDKAKKLLEIVIAGPVEPGYEPETAEWKAQAKKLKTQM